MLSGDASLSLVRLFLISCLRIYMLCILFFPLFSSYPFVKRSEKLYTWWWHALLWSVQRSGPTIIKLCQWASTRRDLFSKEFCDNMASLHIKTTHSQWKFSKNMLNELFGSSVWESFLLSIEKDPIGSGCVAQVNKIFFSIIIVYKAKLDLLTLKKKTGVNLLETNKERFIDVAIKVAKPGIRDQIEFDLSILRVIAHIAEKFIPCLVFLNPVLCLGQFETVLKRQIDLRNEAKALDVRFSNNFDLKTTGVCFPSALLYSRNVIIETFEEGIYINHLVTEQHQVIKNALFVISIPSSFVPAIRKRVALTGIRALLKMIFVDNFVHGDLHPGNILVRFGDRIDELEKMSYFKTFLSWTIEFIRENFGFMHQPAIRLFKIEKYSNEPTLVVLDPGIAIEQAPKNLHNLRALFRAVIEKRGKDVGELLLSQAPQQDCLDPILFCSEVDDLVQRARSINSLKKFNISELLNELFSIVSRHHVYLDTSFTTVILAVMVLEGFGRSLDPELDLFKCARPYLLSVAH
ncbi:unnamed protein product [Dracunculus medinensis]|uniref:ABC1 domain-containing protein n=1 Tax=Dracunculus medinensis TaxID=318479 RepID=A0A0N4UKK3_DRAME|nr:unnamed protein product [Dracunculus medinensis]